MACLVPASYRKQTWYADTEVYPQRRKIQKGEYILWAPKYLWPSSTEKSANSLLNHWL